MPRSSFSGENMTFISIYSQFENRKSSLAVKKDSLKVVGVLNHSDEFAPNSIKDAKILIDWLEKWINKTNIEHDSWEEFNPKY